MRFGQRVRQLRHAKGLTLRALASLVGVGLMLLAERVPESIRRRVLERPDAFRQLAKLDDEALDRVLQCLK